MMNKNNIPLEERPLAERLEALAQNLTPDAKFERELEKRLMNTSPVFSPRPCRPSVGWARWWR
jgi:hypothetical protein